jgi:Rps23 Pro-64 3,4-dihydroxylase Tpa1-like proline 4-hydroxylase
MISTTLDSKEFDFLSNRKDYLQTDPFNYLVIDDFFDIHTAINLSNEFPDFNSELWRQYDNQIENKKLLNHWDKFPALTYKVLTYLNSPEFIYKISKLTGISSLYPDIGLNGGGWHIHGSGGKLNVHKDYVIHPKLGLMRTLNLIVYLTEDWNLDWGGGLGLWSHDDSKNLPKELIRDINFCFNRAILFNTNQNSWHGLPDPITCPQKVQRKSIAVYYLTDPIVNCEQRGKALFAPYKEQMDDPEILDLIQKRSNTDFASQFYERQN